MLAQIDLHRNLAAIPAAKFTRAKNLLDRAEEKFYVVGRVVKGERRVQYT